MWSQAHTNRAVIRYGSYRCVAGSICTGCVDVTVTPVRFHIVQGVGILRPIGCMRPASDFFLQPVRCLTKRIVSAIQMTDCCHVGLYSPQYLSTILYILHWDNVLGNSSLCCLKVLGIKSLNSVAGCWWSAAMQNLRVNLWRCIVMAVSATYISYISYCIWYINIWRIYIQGYVIYVQHGLCGVQACRFDMLPNIQ